MTPSWYPALVALHLIFMVTFFAGTFCLSRLFVLHRQALALWEPDRGILTKQYGRMERTLLYIATWPSLLLMLGFGVWMAWLDLAVLKQPWMQAKLGLTALLIAYHLANQRIYGNLRRGEKVWPAYQLRIWVQVSVLLLFALVFLSTFKQVQWYLGVAGLAVLAILLWSAIKAFGSKDPATNNAEPGKPGA